MSPKPTLSQRIGYIFDNVMSRGTPAMIGVLFTLSAIIVIVVSLIVIATGIGPEGSGFIDIAWMGLMRTLDAGTMGGDQGSWPFLLSMLTVTLGGVFVVSALIGVLTAGVENKLDELRKGRSIVLEEYHTVILGWSTQIFTIVSEIVVANENQRRGVIAILADKDKVAMEDEVRDRVGDMKNTRIICRSGSSIDLNDLEIVSPHTARAIIVLPPEEDEADSYVLKTVLALVNNPNRREDKYQIVTQIRDPNNMDVLRMVGAKDDVHAVLVGDLIARVVAQTSRQSGLSVVYTELLNFSGDEIYFKEEHSLVGRTFGDSLFAFEDSAVMGLRFADGSIKLNPPMDVRIESGDQVISLSADDDTLRLSGLTSYPIQAEAIRRPGATFIFRPEKGLILGWNRCAATIVNELDSYVTSGSKLTVVADAEAEAEISVNCTSLKNMVIEFQKGDTTDRRLLDLLRIVDYDHVIVLADTRLDIQAADARTLVTLLHLRDISMRDETPFSIVSEMLDLRNRQLAEVAHVDDFIVSEHLTSLMMSQLSENGELYDVFTDLFNAEGSEIYLKPVGDYVMLNKPITFYTLLESARQRNEVAIGYRLIREAGDAEKAYGVHTNPRKSEEVTFTAADKVIVLAEN
jgi:voltage-gated potassium channel Kch